MSPPPPHRNEMYMLGHAPFLNQPIRGLASWQVMINRFALSFLCIVLDRDKMFEVMLVYILLMLTGFTIGFQIGGPGYFLKSQQCPYFWLKIVLCWSVHFGSFCRQTDLSQCLHVYECHRGLSPEGLGPALQGRRWGSKVFPLQRP